MGIYDGRGRWVAKMINAWTTYGAALKDEPQDAARLEAWESIGRHLQLLLDWECNTWDSGSLSASMNDAFEEHGFDPYMPEADKIKANGREPQ